MPSRNVVDLVAPLSRPAIQLLKSPDDTGSFFGGSVSLPDGAVWPSKGGQPLTLLACIHLESLHRACPVPWLPASGRLLFFYDVENQPWGFDPKDRGSWVVMLAPHDESRVGSPSPAAQSLRHQSISFRKIATYPSWERPEVVALTLTAAEAENLIEASQSVYGESPGHQIGGFPSPIQSDSMELESQLVSHGIYCGDPSGYESPHAAELEGGSADWRLLLQIDSDDDLGVMWGDAGMLYFWVQEHEARAGRFDNVWVILQCH